MEILKDHKFLFSTYPKYFIQFTYEKKMPRFRYFQKLRNLFSIDWTTLRSEPKKVVSARTG